MLLSKFLPEAIKGPLRYVREYAGWPRAAHREFWRDILGRPSNDPGPQAMIDGGLAWLANAQDCSASQDGGVARHFSLLDGWAASYPETTGYIIPTFLEHARLRGDETLRQRARRMLDFLVSIQLPEGAFHGGTRAEKKQVPVVFDTGQILQGFAAGVREFGDVYREPMIRAADWLARTQEDDGAWRVLNRFTRGSHTWDTHVAWGLFEAARVEPSRGYAETALKNIHWAMTKQTDTGWFDDCCTEDSSQPLTHTLAYVLRGIVEGYIFSRDPLLLASAMNLAEALMTTIDDAGHMPCRFDRRWIPKSNWVCLTGSSQIAICWLLLYVETGDERLREAALKVNSFVRSTVQLSGDPAIAGGVKGSFPIFGYYGRFQFLNWACKFTVDAATLELQLADRK